MPSGRSIRPVPEVPVGRGPRPNRPGRLVAVGWLLLVVPIAFAQEKPSEPLPVKSEGPPEKPMLKEGESPPAAGSEGTPVPNVDRKLSAAPSELTEAQQVALSKELPWFRFIEDDQPLRSSSENDEEHRAYNYVLAHARKQSAEALARQSLKGVPFANLFKKIRQDYLRELIRIEGRLLRLEEYKATSFLQETEGIAKLYEGWVIPKDEQFPVCILFTELPAGLKPARKVDNVWVGFDGYYFKLLRYEADQKKPSGENVWRQAPLLIGRAPQVGKPPEETGGLTFGTLMTGLVVGLAIVIVTALGLSLWFRRGDRRVRARVEQAQFQNNPFSAPPPVEPGAEWGRLGQPPAS